MTRGAAILVALLLACKEDSRRDDESTGVESSGGPSYTDCQDCPIGGSTCPDGQVCASVLPGGGGVCMLACEVAAPDVCVLDGEVTGECKAFHPDGITACNHPERGPVCP